jgi:hypothetical protein
MLAKRTSKNRITLPKRIVDQLPAADYFEVAIEEGKIVLRPVDPASRSGRADLYARAAEVVGSVRHGDGTTDLSIHHDEHFDGA